jgi:cell filamentation protein
MTKYANHDRYLNPATGVLLNKLGITDAAELQREEGDYAFVRSYELSQNPVSGAFDLGHLQAIHKALFSDVYEWAGELRTIDIAKGQSYFAHHAHIDHAAQSIFTSLAAENCLAGADREQFSQRAAYYLGEINALHPFREGNGRTQREFINHLAYKNDYCIEWKNITREEMVQASIDSFKGNFAPFSVLIHENLFDGFAESFATAVDDIRHEVENSAYGRPTRGAIEIPQADVPVIEPAQEIEPPSQNMER